jgi:P22 coat protein - gene protein 5
MTVSVKQNALVLNSFVAMLQNSLTTGDAVSWKKHDGEFDDLNGLQVIEQFSPRYNVVQTVDGVADLSGGVQTSVFGSEIFKVNRTFNVSMGVGDFEKIRDFGAARESRALKAAVSDMAQSIDSYVLGVATLGSHDWVGTAGAVVDDTDEMVSAYTRLKENGVSDMDLRAVMTYTDKQKLGDQVLNLPAPDEEATKALRKGFSGEINNIPTMFTQQLPTLTTGSRAASGASLINGSNQNSNYSAVAQGGATNGLYKTQTIAIDGLTGSQTVAAGDVFTIAGVFAYDPRAGKALDYLQQFTVVTAATASTGAIAALRIYPAIIVPGTGSGGDIGVNTAHATCSAVPADNAAITWMGTASTGYTPRVLLQKDAIEVNTMQLIKPYTGESERRSLPFLPIDVRMWKHSEFNTASGAVHHKVRFDIALSANIRLRDAICRFNGS